MECNRFKVAVNQSRAGFSDVAQQFVMFEQSVVFAAPWVTASVVRVAAAFQTCLVPVIDAGDTGQHKLYRGGKLHQRQPFCSVVGIQFWHYSVVFLVFCGGLAGQKGNGPHRVMGADMVHQGVNRRRGIIFKNAKRLVYQIICLPVLHIGHERG